MAGKIDYIAPVDNASGKIFGLKNRFVSVKRQSGNRIRGCAFMGQRNLVDHPVSADELMIRSNFTAATRLVAERLKKDFNPRYEADMALFKRQTKYTSFKKWLWAEVKNNTIGINYLQYGGKNYFPGGKALEMNVSKDSKLDLVLIPGTADLIGSGAMQVKVNNTAVTNPTLTGDMLQVTLPATLDGMEVVSVVLTADGKTYKLEF